MKYEDFVKQAVALVGDRGKTYGDIKTGLQKAVDIFELNTGVRLTLREAALFQVAFKQARMFESPEHPDHYLDVVNYMAFAAMMNHDEQEERASNVPTRSNLPDLKSLNLGERAVAAAVGGNKEFGG